MEKTLKKKLTAAEIKTLVSQCPFQNISTEDLTKALQNLTLGQIQEMFSQAKNDIKSGEATKMNETYTVSNDPRVNETYTVHEEEFGHPFLTSTPKKVVTN